MILTQIANVDIRAVARQFGTPTYVYDQAMIQQRVADLHGFPVIRFAQKANSNLAILGLMRKLGVVVDAVSAGEIHRAMLAGYQPKDIVYTADIFDRDSLDMVAAHGITVNCGSPDMVRQLGERCPGRGVTLRINPGFGHGHSQKTNTGGEQSKHGIWHDQLPHCLDLARSHKLTITGIHMHIGSGTDFAHLAEVCAALKEAATHAGPDLTMISCGGGLPIPYRPGDTPLDVPAYTRMWLEVQREMQTRIGRPVSLEVEPGRYLVAESGYLIAEIRAIKQQGRNTFYLLNTGFHHLARPVMYGAYHPMSICPMATTERDAAAAEEIDVVVGGPLCESGDIFTQREGGFVESRRMPRARVGDLLTIHCAGAYGFVMASNYNSYPLPAEVLIHDGQARLARARQTFDDLVRGEPIPER